MNPVQKLLREQKEEFEKKFCNPSTMDSKSPLHPDYQDGGIGRLLNDMELYITTAQQQLIDVIIGKLKKSLEYEIYGNKFISDNEELQGIITLLEEAKKNV